MFDELSRLTGDLQRWLTDAPPRLAGEPRMSCSRAHGGRARRARSGSRGAAAVRARGRLAEDGAAAQLDHRRLAPREQRRALVAPRADGARARAAQREPIDIGRVVEMLLVHDLVEIDAGDTFVYDTRRARAEGRARAARRRPPVRDGPGRRRRPPARPVGRVRGERHARSAVRALGRPPGAAAAEPREPRRALGRVRHHRRPRARVQRAHRRRLARPLDRGARRSSTTPSRTAGSPSRRTLAPSRKAGRAYALAAPKASSGDGNSRGGARTIAPATRPSSCSRVSRRSARRTWPSSSARSSIGIAIGEIGSEHGHDTWQHRLGLLRLGASRSCSSPCPRGADRVRRRCRSRARVRCALPCPPGRRRRGRARPDLRRKPSRSRSDCRRRRSSSSTSPAPNGFAAGHHRVRACASRPARSRFRPIKSTRSAPRPSRRWRTGPCRSRAPRPTSLPSRGGARKRSGRRWALLLVSTLIGVPVAVRRGRDPRDRVRRAGHDAAARARRPGDSPIAGRAALLADLDAVRLTQRARGARATAPDDRRQHPHRVDAVADRAPLVRSRHDPAEARNHSTRVRVLDREQQRARARRRPAQSPSARSRCFSSERACSSIRRRAIPKLRAELDRAGSDRAALSSRLAGRSRASRTAAGGSARPGCCRDP